MTLPRHALAASLLAAAATLVTACSSHEPAFPDATVRVEIFSGRENPVVPLDDATARELVAFLDTKAEDAFATLGAPLPLGFAGLVVSLDAVPDTEGGEVGVAPGVDATESTIRVMPHSIYVTDAIGTVRLSDLNGTAFDLVWDAVKPALEPDVVDAVEEEV